ncbi:MAG: MsnO8 family LLM class oxidoreductase [Micrococcaceae bacterium]
MSASRNVPAASDGVPLSLLDRANARGSHGVDTEPSRILAEVIHRARAAEALGFHRFWVAEHHAVPGIAGSAPTVLMASLAAQTERVRIGSGGIMLPDHQPLVMAEQIGTLQALAPGRIDAGLGSSVGFTAPVRRALRQHDSARYDAGDQARELIAYLDGRHEDGAEVTAQPPDRSRTPLFVLASSRSIPLAAQLGTGVVVGGPGLLATAATAAPGDRHEGIATYRREFVPSPHRGQKPWVMIAVSVAVAETREQASRLALPEAWALTRSRTVGSFEPLQPDQELDVNGLNPRERERLDNHLSQVITGTQEQVRAQLEHLVEFTGADEVLVTGGMADPADQRRSDELLAQVWGI